MASKDKIPSTPAVLMLRAAGVEFTPHFYDQGGDMSYRAAMMQRRWP